MFNPFRKKSSAKEEQSEKSRQTEIRRMAEEAIDVLQPEDLRELAEAALKKMAHG